MIASFLEFVYIYDSTTCHVYLYNYLNSQEQNNAWIVDYINYFCLQPMKTQDAETVKNDFISCLQLTNVA